MKIERRLISVTWKSNPDQIRTITRTKTVQAGLPLGFHPSMPGPFSHISASSIWRPNLLHGRNDKAPALAPRSRPRERFTAQQISACSQPHTTSSTRKREALYVQKSDSGSGQGHVRGVVPVPTGEARHAKLFSLHL